MQQGRTEAWIAHQLEVSASELRDFIRRNDLSSDEESTDDHDLRDEIEAEIEAAMEAEEDEEEEADEDEADDEEASDDSGDSDGGSGRRQGGEGRQGEGGGGGRRRRRRRRGPKRTGAGLEATFDHGDEEGYGLWLDPAIAKDPVYEENWKGKRKVEVTVEPDQIVIRRAD